MKDHTMDQATLPLAIKLEVNYNKRAEPTMGNITLLAMFILQM